MCLKLGRYVNLKILTLILKSQRASFDSQFTSCKIGEFAASGDRPESQFVDWHSKEISQNFAKLSRKSEQNAFGQKVAQKVIRTSDFISTSCLVC